MQVAVHRHWPILARRSHTQEERDEGVGEGHDNGDDGDKGGRSPGPGTMRGRARQGGTSPGTSPHPAAVRVVALLMAAVAGHHRHDARANCDA